jgi:hypothetical protein
MSVDTDILYTPTHKFFHFLSLGEIQFFCLPRVSILEQREENNWKTATEGKGLGSVDISAVMLAKEMGAVVDKW